MLDGLGDTIRVSLTEDPEYELEPCRFLARNVGLEATTNLAKAESVPKYVEKYRDFTSYEKRKGDLPVQKESDPIDLRSILHRDGSVISAVTLDDLKKPDLLYSTLGCKTAVGMPFKDIATSDSIFLRKAPGADEKDARTVLRRLQESGLGLLVPVAELEANPIPNAIAVYTLKQATAGINLPKGALRYAIMFEGDESDQDLEKLVKLEPVMGIISVKPTLSRVHAARRIFDFLYGHQLNFPVIHHAVFGQVSKDEMIIRSGSEIGALLVDGYGDGVMIEAPEDLDFVRKTSFGLLQGSRMRNVKTEYVSCPSCGRTLFNLQETTAAIQKKTGHLPGVAIAVMGCIVNGPGEMADADFGYVGGAPGKVDLYVGKEMVKKGIPNDEACDALVELIKSHGRWIEPPEAAEVAPKEKELVAA